MSERTLTDADLDRLETLLGDPRLDEVMRIDEMQGFLCAALAGPVPWSDDELIAEIVGEPEESAAALAEEARGLIRRILDEVRRQLDEEALVLWLYPAHEGDDAPMDYAPWGMAYLHGVDQAQEDWFDELDEEEAAYLDERLYPLMVVTGEAEAAAKQHGESWPEGEELVEMTNDCQDSILPVVEEMYRFWKVKRGVGTVRRESPKQGRNDPCACGSGKKYKQCCGAV